MSHPKRFYKEVSLEHGQLLLDGKGVKCKSGQPLAHSSQKLMRSVAEEWAEREKNINYREMPLTRLLMAALELNSATRSAIIAHVLSYSETDLLCYHAPDDLVLAAKQRAGWNAWLEWLQEKHGIALHSTSGIIPIQQEEGALFHLRFLVEGKTDEALVALNELTATLGSLVLAIALQEGAVAAEEAIALSLLDETHQAERWGEDAAFLQLQAEKTADITAIARFLLLL